MKELVKDILIAVVIAALVLVFIKPIIINESSMEPSLHENDYIFISRQAYTIGEPERGDIIVFHSELKRDNGKEKLLIKRVIGIPGDTVAVRNNDVYINGESISEDYVKDEDVIPGNVEVEVPEGKLFVMGDNRRVSIDSRYEKVGLVDIDDVMGVAFVRLYPFKDISLL